MTNAGDVGDGRAPTGPRPTTDTIPVLRPLLPDAGRLLPYLRRIDASRTYTNWGPLASELEARLASKFGLPTGGVTSASSGTAALVGAILATAGRALADRPLALVPAFTFVATALAAEQCGYRPHLVDVDAESWRVHADTLYDHPLLAQVGLVIPVAPFGRAVPQAPWLEFRRKTGVAVAIDGGASFEAISADPAPFVGEVPVALSFHATKSFSTAEGGCVLTTDPRAGVQVGQALNFGFFATRECLSASTNGKMSEYHAAIGLATLDDWPATLAALQTIASFYRRQLELIGLSHRIVVAPDVAGCYALFRCSDGPEAAHLGRSLTASHIGSRFWYGRGLHRQPHYADASRDDVAVAEHTGSCTIGLPVAPDLTSADIDRVVSAIAKGVHDRV
jgi:dTDP-4-amino-4,6-dideoxygalactose transaminase